MFNLIVAPSDWEVTKKGTIPVERVFEYTEPALVNKFRNENSLDFEKLKKLPCLFMNEGTEKQRAYVGHLISLHKSYGQILFEYTIDNDIPLLNNSVLYTNRLELDISHDFEFSRCHWSIKNTNIYRVLFHVFKQNCQKPNVFDISEHKDIDRSLVSAMMPFDASFTAVYKSIQQAAKNAELICKRADDFWEHDAIMQDVVTLIDRAMIVVCDCTGRNPNVFYETGIAHTLGRNVILITQNPDDIPFDLRHLRYILYLNNKEGRAKLTKELQARMETLLKS